MRNSDLPLLSHKVPDHVTVSVLSFVLCSLKTILPLAVGRVDSGVENVFTSLCLVWGFLSGIY